MRRITREQAEIAKKVLRILIERDEFNANKLAVELGCVRGRVFDQALWVAMEEAALVGRRFRPIGKGTGDYRLGGWREWLVHARGTRAKALRALSRALNRIPPEHMVPEKARPQVRRMAERYASIDARMGLVEDNAGRREVRLFQETHRVKLPDVPRGDR